MEDGLKLLPLAQIAPSLSNPRTFFDSEQMRELEDSIRANGVAQPIIVRPVGADRYEIIGGERRWRAAAAVYGLGGRIPALIKAVGVEQAQTLALVENTVRADMSATDEAQAAQRLLLRLKGDKAEAAASLGWAQSKLNRRLALLNLVKEVREALTRQEIQLGHAELLAAVAQEKQAGALTKIIEHGLTVAQVKAQIGQMANDLNAAIFDKSECASCPYNSDQQRSLFAEAVSEGRCTNPTCYEQKSESALNAVASNLRDEVPRVEVVRGGDAVAPIKLVAMGRLGVGQSQFSACKGCANYGCTVSAMTGSMGEVERDVCFDATCHTVKVAKWVKEQRASAAASAGAANTADAEPTKSSAPSQVKPTVSGTPTVGKGSASALSRPVLEYRTAQWRGIAAKCAYKADWLTVQALWVALCAQGKARDVDSTKSAEALSKLAAIETPRRGGGGGCASLAFDVQRFMAANEETGQALVRATVASVFKGIESSELPALMAYLGVDMSQHWKLNKDLLNLLTKSEIEALAKDLGLDDAMGAKAFAKAIGGKKGECIEALLTVAGFDYSRTPRLMQWQSEVSQRLHNKEMPKSAAPQTIHEDAEQGSDEVEAQTGAQTDAQGEEQSEEQAQAQFA
jgi:ParB family chromosome partitioning protein